MDGPPRIHPSNPFQRRFEVSRLESELTARAYELIWPISQPPVAQTTPAESRRVVEPGEPVCRRAVGA